MAHESFAGACDVWSRGWPSQEGGRVSTEPPATSRTTTPAGGHALGLRGDASVAPERLRDATSCKGHA